MLMSSVATVAALQELRRMRIELLDVDAAVRAGSVDYLIPAIEQVASKTREHFGFDTWLGLTVVDDYGRLPDQLVIHYCPATDLSAEWADAFRTACENVREFEQVWAWPMFSDVDVPSLCVTARTATAQPGLTFRRFGYDLRSLMPRQDPIPYPW